MDVSIIIVNYNTSKLLSDCVYSIIENTKDISYEIIVVDNGSIDDSILMLHNNFPQIKLIENNVNLGFGSANNQGAKFSKGKYLFLLNTDTFLINNAITILFNFMEEESSEGIGACGGNLFKYDKSPNYSFTMCFPSLFNIFCYRAHLKFLLNDENFNYSGKIKDVAIIIGADLFIRKKLYYELGGFDPSIFMYVEDGELLYRVKKMGIRVVSNPEAKIMHLQGSSSPNIFKLKTEISSYTIYFRKHYNVLATNIYLLMEIFFVSLKVLYSILSFNKNKSKEFISILRYILRVILKKVEYKNNPVSSHTSWNLSV